MAMVMQMTPVNNMKVKLSPIWIVLEASMVEAAIRGHVADS